MSRPPQEHSRGAAAPGDLCAGSLRHCRLYRRLPPWCCPQGEPQPHSQPGQRMPPGGWLSAEPSALGASRGLSMAVFLVTAWPHSGMKKEFIATVFVGFIYSGFLCCFFCVHTNGCKQPLGEGTPAPVPSCPARALYLCFPGVCSKTLSPGWRILE